MGVPRSTISDTSRAMPLAPLHPDLPPRAEGCMLVPALIYIHQGDPSAVGQGVGAGPHGRPRSDTKQRCGRLSALLDDAMGPREGRAGVLAATGAAAAPATAMVPAPAAVAAVAHLMVPPRPAGGSARCCAGVDGRESRGAARAVGVGAERYAILACRQKRIQSRRQ
eukprot:350380-Chlamydomonas_euryale.AAC.11